MNNIIVKKIRLILLIAACLAIAAGTAMAVSYDLRADRVNITMPDGTVVPAWGFADDVAGAGTGTVTVPGPQLIVPAGDTQLIVNLRNNLPVPVSINVPGQPYPDTTTPTYVDDGKGNRVMSFTRQVAANSGPVTITFNNLRPGTFRYESGTHPSMEVPMGLYGALIVRPATAGQAYNNISSAYDNEAVLLLSDIDPLFNAYVDVNSSPVDTVNRINYSISYAPRYYLINGKAYPQTSDIPAPVGQRTLLRLVNASPRNIMPAFEGSAVTVIAEDGYLLNYPRHEFAVALTAGKTLDIITAPTATGYRAFYDRRLGMANAGVFPGGMLTFIGDLNCSPLKGDVTGDGKVGPLDAMTVLQAYVAGTTNTLPVNAYGPVADVSLDTASGLPCGNGLIDLDDVLRLLQKVTGLNPY
jgi:FtsP/CotA-like multicopper oxidase with cupredoxin domain